MRNCCADLPLCAFKKSRTNLYMSSDILFVLGEAPDLNTSHLFRYKYICALRDPTRKIVSATCLDACSTSMQFSKSKWLSDRQSQTRHSCERSRHNPAWCFPWKLNPDRSGNLQNAWILNGWLTNSHVTGRAFLDTCQPVGLFLYVFTIAFITIDSKGREGSSLVRERSLNLNESKREGSKNVCLLSDKSESAVCLIRKWKVDHPYRPISFVRLFTEIAINRSASIIDKLSCF
jgi:hypothetical protein